MLKIAICDDDIFIRKELELIIQNYCEYLQYEYDVSSFCDAETLLKTISTFGNYDIIFLDIRLERMNGIEAGEIIRNVNHDERTKIIFISAIKDYVFDAFAARPLNYILKPLNKEKVERVIKKTIELIEEERGVFIYKSGHYKLSLYLSDIIYFESVLRKIQIITSTECKEFYGKISDLLEKNLYNFIQIHRSYLINADQVYKYTYTSVKMKNGHELSISQNRRSEVMESLTRLSISKLREY